MNKWSLFLHFWHLISSGLRHTYLRDENLKSSKMEILIFKTHFFKFEISKGAVIRSGMVQSDMWNKQKRMSFI